jgi:hypothetical protein
MEIDYQTIAHHFCIAAVWADCEEGTSPRITAKSLENAERYARAFIAENYALSVCALEAPGYGPERFGHDLWLTARGHGAGFWDRSELGDTGRALADVLRDWQTWEVEADFYRGWLEFDHPKASDEYAPVRVVFRTWRSGHGKGEVIALMPDIEADTRGNCESYEHVGQHGAADYRGVIARTRAATPEEFAPLLRELTGAPFFYRLKIVNRR